MSTIEKDLAQADRSIIEHADRYAGRKSATLNMRIHENFLTDLKEAAKKEGFDQYQTWVAIILQDAILAANGIQVEKFPSDNQIPL